MIFHSEPDGVLHLGDALAVLRSLPDASVDCCVTSPPYWGLRDYGVEGQIGNEKTPGEYIAKMVEVFREVRRVLKPTGNLFLNLGDSYAASWPCSRRNEIGSGSLGNGKRENRPERLGDGLKTKDLCGIPWRVAFALQDDGWYLRNDIIWHKNNPMPESVKDRCTRAHEYIFHFVKGQSSIRTVKFSDLSNEFAHFFTDAVKSNATSRLVAEACRELALSIFNFSQVEKKFCLPPLNSEIWQECLEDRDCLLVPCLPSEHRFCANAASFLCGNRSAEQFLEEIDSLWRDLRNGDDLLIRWLDSQFSSSPNIHPDRDRTIRINNAGKVCEINFSHHSVVYRTASTCSYFYDADAIREPSTYAGPNSPESIKSPYGQGFTRAAGKNESSIDRRKVGFNERWDAKERGRPGGRRPDEFDVMISGAGRSGVGEGTDTRNKRSVWTIPTCPFPGAHFAVFPPEIPRLCILAGCPTNGVVLDPFGGSGTTAMVAKELGRRYITGDLSDDYCEMIVRRVTGVTGSLFAGMETQ